MPRLVLLVVLLVPGGHSLLAAPVPAGPAPKQLTELPVAADSMVVVHLNGLERTRQRVAKLLDGVADGFTANLMKQADALLADVLGERDMKAIDGKSRIFVAMGDVGQLASPDAPVAVCLPVPDYKVFREKFLTAGERKTFVPNDKGVDEFEATGTDRTTYLVNKDGYVTVTFNKALAEQYAGKYERLAVKTMGRPADGFLAADLSAYLNLEQVNSIYGEQIKQGRQLLNLVLQQGGAGLDKKQLEMAKEVFQSVFQMVEDGRGLAIGFDFRPEGLAIRLETRFGTDTAFGKLIAAQTPTALAALGDQPKGMMSYSATKWKVDFGQLLKELAADPDDEKSVTAVDEWTKLLAAGGSDSVSINADPRTSLTLRNLAEADQASAAMLKAMKSLSRASSYGNIQLKARPEVAEKAESHAGFTLHRVELRLDFEATVEKLANDAQREAAIASMKKLSPETVTQWFGSNGKQLLVVTAADWTTAKALLDRAMDKKTPASADLAFQATRKQLPAAAGTLHLFDMVAGITFVSDYLESLGGALPGLPVEFPKVGKVKGEPTYLGFAVGLSGDTARVDLFVPLAAGKLIRQAIGDE